MPVPKNLPKIPWLAHGYRELLNHVGRYGSVDGHGKAVAAHDAEGHIRNNPRILEYFAATERKGKGQWTESDSWCSAFVNWCMRQSGVTGTRSAMARSWLRWHGGDELEQPRVGAVVVFPRSGNPHLGHVAMVWSVQHNDLEVLGGNQDAHRATRHSAAVSSHVSIRKRTTAEALGFFWPKHFHYADGGGAHPPRALGDGTMLILRGKAGHYGGRDWPRGALEEQPALDYARRRGYTGRVLDVKGDPTTPSSPQVLMALEEFRRDESITALYGFSAGGYNVHWIIHALTPTERKRLQLVVVLGAPRKDRDLSYRGSWELVYREDPAEGHMAGPRVLLAGG